VNWLVPKRSVQRMILTEGPLSRVHKHSEILVSEAMCAVIRMADVGRIKRERGMKLDLAFGREVMERLQRL